MEQATVGLTSGPKGQQARGGGQGLCRVHWEPLVGSRLGVTGLT